MLISGHSGQYVKHHLHSRRFEQLTRSNLRLPVGPVVLEASAGGKAGFPVDVGEFSTDRWYKDWIHESLLRLAADSSI